MESIRTVMTAIHPWYRQSGWAPASMHEYIKRAELAHEKQFGLSLLLRRW